MTDAAIRDIEYTTMLRYIQEEKSVEDIEKLPNAKDLKDYSRFW